jgi:RimJ/RimL family protein N-acetyltransferase
MGEVPEILTPRLRLRAHSPDDYAPAVDLWQNPEVYRHITGTAPREQDVWMRLLRYRGLWDFLGFGYWALEERSSGQYIGQLGFADFKRPLEGVDCSLPEAGWVVHPAAAGRGYATEAMQAACEWLDSQAASSHSFCIIAPGNRRSVRLAARLGYAFVKEILFNGDATAYYQRPRGAGTGSGRSCGSTRSPDATSGPG